MPDAAGPIAVPVVDTPYGRAAAHTRAIELGVADQVSFIPGDASDHVADQPVDLASCIGATWIGAGVPGTVELLRRSLRPGGTMLIGELGWQPARRCR